MTLAKQRAKVLSAGGLSRAGLVALAAVLAAVVGVLYVLWPEEEPTPVKSPAPAGVAVSDEYDFGFIEPEGRREVVLAVANDAVEPVQVTAVRSGCPCITAATLKDTFPVGEPLAVRVTFTASKKVAHYTEPLYIDTASSRDRPRRILIRADVGLPLATEPRSPNFGPIAAGSVHDGQITVLNRSDRPVRLLYSTSPLPGCVLKAPVEPVPPGGKLVVPVEVRVTSGGSQTVTFDVTTDAPSQPSFPVSVRFAGAEVVPGVKVESP